MITNGEVFLTLNPSCFLAKNVSQPLLSDVQDAHAPRYNYPSANKRPHTTRFREINTVIRCGSDQWGKASGLCISVTHRTPDPVQESNTLRQVTKTQEPNQKQVTKSRTETKRSAQRHEEKNRRRCTEVQQNQKNCWNKPELGRMKPERLWTTLLSPYWAPLFKLFAHTFTKVVWATMKKTKVRQFWHLGQNLYEKYIKANQ